MGRADDRRDVHRLPLRDLRRRAPQEPPPVAVRHEVGTEEEFASPGTGRDGAGWLGLRSSATPVPESRGPKADPSHPEILTKIEELSGIGDRAVVMPR